MLRNAFAALTLSLAALNAAPQGAAPATDPAVRASFMAMMRDEQLLATITQITRESLARNLTAEELNALADFYSQPIARSATSKMDTYMADIAPRMIHEILQRARANQISGKGDAGRP